MANSIFQQLREYITATDNAITVGEQLRELLHQDPGAMKEIEKTIITQEHIMKQLR